MYYDTFVIWSLNGKLVILKLLVYFSLVEFVCFRFTESSILIHINIHSVDKNILKHSNKMWGKQTIADKTRPPNFYNNINDESYKSAIKEALEITRTFLWK